MSMVYSHEAGHFVSEDHVRIASIIKDYDPALRLTWIPPDQRAFDETQPYAIEHITPDGRAYVVRRVAENEVDHRLIAWLASNDQQRNGNDLNGYLDKVEAAYELVKAKAKEESDAEINDFVTSVLGGKNYYMHHGRKYS